MPHITVLYSVGPRRDTELPEHTESLIDVSVTVEVDDHTNNKSARKKADPVVEKLLKGSPLTIIGNRAYVPDQEGAFEL